MANHIVIDTTHGRPSIETLRQVLALHESVEFSYLTSNDDYTRELTYIFPEYYVFERQWDRVVFIYPSIHSDRILSKKQDLYDAARSFREDGNRLMRVMSEIFGINLETLDGLGELKYKKSKKQRGDLNEEWSYFFHGAECRFDNKLTGQIVEIIITTYPEFGYLDHYFFYHYMATTERFKPLAAYFDHDHMHIAKAIDLLAVEGILTRVQGARTARNGIAL